MCRGCLDNSSKSTRNYRSRRPGLGKQTYADRKAAGVCTHCAVEGKPLKYGTLCEGCGLAEKQRALRIKQEVMNLYGGACACCGEDHIAFLTIDHIPHDGTAKRKSKEHSGGGSLYKKLRRKPVDPTLQVLCWNCNLGRRVTGVCPHIEDGYFKSATARGTYERQGVVDFALPRARERNVLLEIPT